MSKVLRDRTGDLKDNIDAVSADDDDLSLVESELNNSNSVDFNMQDSVSPNFFDRGIMTLGEYKILKKLTGSTLLSAGITVGGQMIGILPKSVSPVLSAVGSMVGKDTKIGSTLIGFSERLLPKEDSEVRFAIKDNLLSDLNGDYDSKGFVQNMGENAKATVKADAFLSDDISEDINLGKQVCSNALEALDADIEKTAGKDNKFSSEDKKLYDQHYQSLKSGFETYRDAASAEIDKQYKDPADIKMAKDNMNQFTDAVLRELDNHVQEMDAKYGFSGSYKSESKKSSRRELPTLLSNTQEKDDEFSY